MKELTSGMEVIGFVSGMPINIASNLPIINKYQYPFNDKEDAFSESEIQNLLKKRFIRNFSHEPGEFHQYFSARKVMGIITLFLI